MKVIDKATSLKPPRRLETMASAATLRASSIPKTMALSRSSHLLELACTVVDSRRGGIGLLSADGDLVEHIPFGNSEEAAGTCHAPWLGELVRFILSQSTPVCLEDLAAQDPRLGRPADLPPLGPFLGLPLHCLGRTRGRAVHRSRPRGAGVHPARPGKGRADSCLAGAGRPVRGAHLLSQLRLLNRVVQAVAGNLDLSQLLERGLRELDRYFPLHLSAVWLGNDSRCASLTLAATSSLPDPRTAALPLYPGMQLPLENTPFGVCLKNGQGCYTDLGDGAAQGPVSAGFCEALAAQGATCFFAAPLCAGDQMVGVLQSICTRPAGFTGEQIQLLYLVADLLGPSISSCQLFGRLRTTYEELRATQDRLIQAEKMRALGELSSGMAHEFNNSLCGVLGFLELTLLDKTLAATSRNHLESARTCAMDAAQTVLRVQDFSRPRPNASTFRPLDVNELIHQTIELTRHKWESLSQALCAPVVVEIQAQATAPVAGNAAELREVLTNLVFNATDAMPDGGTLALHSWSTTGSVFLSVRDTGVGMSASVRQRLFEPFFTTKGERGNGLGLSVTFGIVQRHGGEITVASEVGQGTTLTVRLPAAPDGMDAIPSRPEVLAPPLKVSQGLRILVVEDEESIRRFLGKVMQQFGHRATLTADASEALAALAQEPFDLVLTDLGLPRISGEELARTIASQSPQTPVVLLTGWAEQLKAEAKPLTGVTRILAKPITIPALAEALEAVCPRGR